MIIYRLTKTLYKGRVIVHAKQDLTIKHITLHETKN